MHDDARRAVHFPYAAHQADAVEVWEAQIDDRHTHIAVLEIVQSRSRGLTAKHLKALGLHDPGEGP